MMLTTSLPSHYFKYSNIVYEYEYGYGYAYRHDMITNYIYTDLYDANTSIVKSLFKM